VLQNSGRKRALMLPLRTGRGDGCRLEKDPCSYMCRGDRRNHQGQRGRREGLGLTGGEVWESFERLMIVGWPWVGAEGLQRDVCCCHCVQGPMILVKRIGGWDAGLHVLLGFLGGHRQRQLGWTLFGHRKRMRSFGDFLRCSLEIRTSLLMWILEE
jgi:hypothetical protein